MDGTYDLASCIHKIQMLQYVYGVGRAFKKAKMETQIQGCEPANAAMLQSVIRAPYYFESRLGNRFHPKSRSTSTG
jgi:cysteine synthase